MRSLGILTAFVAMAGWGAAPRAQTVAPESFFKASNPSPEDRFGVAVALDGDTLVVSSPYEGSPHQGAATNPDSNAQSGAGAVYIFSREAGGWVQQSFLKLTTPNSQISFGRFGRSLALDGDTLAVGYKQDDIFGDAGRVLVLERVGAMWIEQAIIEPPPGVPLSTQDRFGISIALDGDTLVVGMDSESSSATGIDGSMSSQFAQSSGAVFVYERVAGSWNATTYIKASNADPFDAFGRAVAIGGDTIVVGAPGEDSAANVIDGDQFNDPQPHINAGAAYVFERSGDSWAQQAYLKPSKASGDGFGNALAIDGDTALVGAQRYGVPCEGLAFPGGPPDGCGGGAYVFRRSGSTWFEEAILEPAEINDEDLYGSAVALRGSRALLGGPWEDSGAKCVDGNAANNSVDRSGAAVLFVREDGAWVEHAYLKAGSPGEGDRFGSAVAMDQERIVVGAPFEDSGAPGIDGPQGGGSGGLDIGAVYSFRIDPWSDEGCALAGTSGFPNLQGEGTLFPGALNAVALTNAAPLAFSGIFIGTASNPAMFKGGMLKPVPWLKLAFANTTAQGTLSLPFLMPSGVPAGTELWVQVAVSDAAAPIGVALSNALRATTP